VLVVGHRGTNRALLCFLLGRPLEELFSIRQEYGCVNLITASIPSDGSLRTSVVTPWVGSPTSGS
jgi:broad specificity phosphatase PhoE